MASRVFLFLLVCVMSFSLASINCNGLRTKSKLKNVFSLLQIKNYDIVCIQETFWDDSFVTNFVKHHWEGDILYSNHTQNSQGVAILFRKNAGIKILSYTEIVKGRILEAKIEIDDDIFNVHNVYAPNSFKERTLFFEKYNNVVNKISNNNCIVAGDFNCVSHPYDKSNVMYADTSRPKFLNLLASNNLYDVWREQHPHDREFTWRRVRLNKLIQSRIDKILAASSIRHSVSHSSIVPFSMSDHDLVLVRFDLSRVTRGEGTWKFNRQLLKNAEFCEDIRACICRSKCDSMYNDDLIKWYEDLKLNFKCIAISHAKRMVKEKRKNKNQLIKCIKHEYKKAAKYNDYDLSLCKKLESDLHAIEVEESQGAIIRCKIKEIELGEKSTKYFFALEKFRHKCNDIKMLKCDDGSIANTSPDILKEGFKFYSKLFCNEPCNNISEQDEFIDNITSSLNSEDVSICSNPITLDDLEKALSEMENNKSPGSDGLTREFYRFFFVELGSILLKVTHVIHECGELPESMSQGIVSLVPKKGDTTSLKNWRPISLLNIDYKIITKALAAKITKVIGNIISQDQTCCIPGRDIADNVLAMRDLVDYIDEQKLSGYLVKIDQKKAFDRVNHNYLRKVLIKFGFPDYFVKWINTIYGNAKSCVKINDFLSDYFPISRGIRQGCPLSAILYVLSAEPVRNAVVNSPDINGFDVGGTRALFFQHADDSTAFVSDLDSVNQVFNIYDLYNRASGSKVNVEKSEILPLGRAAINPPSNLAVKVISDYVEVLGLHIGKDKKNCMSKNWDNKIDKCIKLMNTWKARSLSLKGKVLIANSLVISRIIYIMNLSIIPDVIVTKIKNAIVDFIWSGKRHRINYKVLISPVEMGGMGLLDIDRMKCALRCKFIRKLYDDERPLNPVTKALIEYNLCKYKGMNLGRDIFRISISKNHAKRLPRFYEEMLLAWKRLTCGFFVRPQNANELLDQPLFDNPIIEDHIGNSIYIKEFISVGILRIRDLIIRTSKGFLPIDTVISPLESKVKGDSQYEVKVDRLYDLYFKLFWCIPQKWRINIVNKVLDVHTNEPSGLFIQPDGFDDPVSITKLTTRDINRLLRKYDSTNLMPAGQTYWSNYFGDINLRIPFHLCYGGLKENHQAQIDYFICHNVLYNNLMLNKMKLEDSTLCTFCQINEENTDHLVTICYEVRALYISVWNICEKLIGRKVPCDDFTFMALFGYKNYKFKKTSRLINLILSIYRYSVWSARKWTKKGQKVNLKFIFKSFIQNRLKIEYQKYVWEDNVSVFFDVFGINNAIIKPSREGYVII